MLGWNVLRGTICRMRLVNWSGYAAHSQVRCATNLVRLPILLWYYCPMITRVTACRCDVCGHTWIPYNNLETSPPQRCPSRKCRSIAWNRSQDVSGVSKAIAPPAQPQASNVPQGAIPDEMGRYRKCKHGNNEWTCNWPLCNRLPRDKG